MKKQFESLKSSKFGKFEDCSVKNLQNIIGGSDSDVNTMKMSWKTSSGDIDTADLTCCSGKDYDGQPGDGTASDWANIKWYTPKQVAATQP